MAETPGNPIAPRRLSAPALAPVLAIVALNSLGTGAIMNGVFFLAREQHGFSERRNLLLGLVLGATYIVGAAGIGPLIRRLAANTRVSARSALVWIHLLMGLLCMLPQFGRGEWGIWVFAVTYSPLTGAMWPIVESYLSGGRRGRRLREAVGAFNLVWASAVIVAYWAMSLALGDTPPAWARTIGIAGRPMVVITALGIIHLLTIGIVSRLTPAPARELQYTHDPHPQVYVDLLRATRWLLVLSYILVCALNPILPTRIEAIGADADVGARVASAWAVSRLGVFMLMQRWHGWHGRWRTTVWAGGAMAGGFAMTVLATSMPALIAGLAVFGVGVGGVYCAALYYAMEVGHAEVEAGGMHEALIGLGYTTGPFIGLAPWLAHGAGWIGETQVAPGIVALSVVAGVITLLGALWPARGRFTRRGRR